jgi:hypothetical protein
LIVLIAPGQDVADDARRVAAVLAAVYVIDLIIDASSASTKVTSFSTPLARISGVKYRAAVPMFPELGRMLRKRFGAFRPAVRANFRTSAAARPRAYRRHRRILVDLRTEVVRRVADRPEEDKVVRRIERPQPDRACRRSIPSWRSWKDV